MILTVELARNKKKSAMGIPNHPQCSSYLINEESQSSFVFPSFFLSPDSSILPIVGGNLRLISEITKVSIKIYYAQANKYFRQTFSKRCR